jgi:hypothetical protein
MLPGDQAESHKITVASQTLVLTKLDSEPSKIHARS